MQHVKEATTRPVPKPLPRSPLPPEPGSELARELLRAPEKMPFPVFYFWMQQVKLLNTGPDHIPTLSRKRRDRLYWTNTLDRGYTIHFAPADWPFSEPYQDILVPAHGDSAMFSIFSGQAIRDYRYSIIPEIVPATGTGGGPGDPVVSVQD